MGFEKMHDMIIIIMTRLISWDLWLSPLPLFFPRKRLRNRALAVGPFVPTSCEVL
jgi:hypothetical protein